ncbi:MAG: DsbA family protein [Gemmatimonadota bacterium]
MARSGEAKGSPKGSGKRPYRAALLAVAVLGIGALAYAVIGGGGAVTEPVELEGAESPQALMERADPVPLGAEDAPITVIEFGDFQCPACGVFARQVKPFLEAEYIETGQVRLIFYDFPLISIHEHAFLAARAARCSADQGRYWEYHDRLFGAQPRWSSARNPVSEFVEYAEELGLDADEFEGCVESDRHADVVSASRELALQLGVQSTPTVMVNGRQLVAATDYDALKQMIEEELGG